MNKDREMSKNVISKELVLTKQEFANILGEERFSNYLFTLFDLSNTGSIDGSEWRDSIWLNLG